MGREIRVEVKKLFLHIRKLVVLWMFNDFRGPRPENTTRAGNLLFLQEINQFSSFLSSNEYQFQAREQYRSHCQPH